MDEQVPDAVSAPMSRAAMAKAAGVGETTLKNWAEREEAPLVTVAAPNGRTLYTWLHLRDFCLANPTLTAARRVVSRYRELFVDLPSGQVAPHSIVGAVHATRSRPASSEAVLSDRVTLRSLLAGLKTQLHQHDAVVAAAAQLAQDVGRSQAALLERVEVLELAFAELRWGEDPSRGSA